MHLRWVFVALPALAACDLVAPIDKAHGTTEDDTGTNVGTTGPGTNPANPPVGQDGVLECRVPQPVGIGVRVPLEVECETPIPTPEPGTDGLPACTTAELQCGDTVEGTIAGGSVYFDNNRGHAWEWCSGHSTGSQLEGPERAYKLQLPPTDTYVSLSLASCERTQLLWYQTSDACPTDRVTCSYATVDGASCQGEDILLSGSGIMYIVVESLNGSEGNFKLHVECGET
jgi:hypothetical protein